jgi:hypothetical protein
MNKQNRKFQAFIGYLIDLYKLVTCNFSNPHSYTKFRIIKNTKKKVNANVFIETGTYLGVTTKRCAPFFKQVYTVELDQQLAEQAKQFLKSSHNVKVIQGDALEVLPKILEKKDIDDILVFLDGHFSGGITACGELPEPAIEELKILANSQKKIAAIIIDDFRLFGTEPGFPTKSALFQAIEDHLPSFSVTVALDQVLILRETAIDFN